MNWHYSQNGEKFGPLSSEEFSSLIASGAIRDDTLVWTTGMPEWRSLRDLRRLPELLGGADMAFCAETGRLLPKDQMTRIGNAYVSPERKDAYVQKIQEGASAPVGEMTYAGFWIRFVAKIIDGIITGVVNWAIMLAFGLIIGGAGVLTQSDDAAAAAGLVIMGVSYLVTFAVGALYNLFFLPKYGATPGKMALGLKVVNPDASHISGGKAVGRFFAEILSGMVLLIGYIIAAFDDEKRALHDHLCSTRVIVK